MAGEVLQRCRSGVRAFASTAYLWMSPVHSLTRVQFIPHAITSACTISSSPVQSPRPTRGLGHVYGHVVGEVAGLTRPVTILVGRSHIIRFQEFKYFLNQNEIMIF